MSIVIGTILFAGGNLYLGCRFTMWMMDWSIKLSKR